MGEKNSNEKMMLDVDLAEIYGYETKNFNRQVKNNYPKFEGEDFMIQLTDEETETLSRCENCTLNKGTGRGKNVKYNPHAFTEQGIYMLMTVLRGEVAIQQSRALIRTFKEMKDYIIENPYLMEAREYLQLSMQISDNINKTMELRSDLDKIENQMSRVVERLDETIMRSELHEFIDGFSVPQVNTGYLILNGEPFKADIAYSEIYGQAKRTIFIVDNYIGIKTLELLINCEKEIKISIFSDNLVGGLRENFYNDFCREYPDLHITLFRAGGIFHDRYIVLDYGTGSEKIFLCGASSKDAGKRISSIIEDPDRQKYYSMIEGLLKNPPLVLK